MRLLLSVLSAALFLFPQLAFAGANSFAEITAAEPSVRANGMADAYTAASDDPYGVYYNPALTSENKAVAFAFQRGYADDSTGVLALALPRLVGGFSLGLSFLYYNTGKMDLFTSGGSKRAVIGEKDHLGMVSLSRRFGVYSFGANMKLARIALFETASDSTGLLDLGFLADYPLVRLGFAVQNLGGKMKLGTEEERVASNWRLGLSRLFSFGAVDITGAADMVKRENEPAYFRAGSEFVYGKTVALRAGYEFQNSLSADNNLRFGCGFLLKSMTLDYAMVSYQNLGATHRFALSYKFDGADESPANHTVSAVPVPYAVETVKPEAVSVATTAVVSVPPPSAVPAAEPVAAPVASADSALPIAPAVSALAVAPTVSAAVSATGLKLDKVVITDSVENREPGEARASFASGTNKVYCWMKVSGTTTETLKLVWYADGKYISTASAQIKSDPMRTWNTKTVVPGDWKVEIVDSNNAVLYAGEFTVMK